MVTLMKVTFESKGDFNKVTSWLNTVTNRNPSTVMNQIANEGTRRLAAGTPKDTGATASGWKEIVTTKGNVTEIAWVNTAHPNAGVNVAKIIELGHGTRTGGYVPPKPYIKQAMNPLFNSVGDKVVKEMIK